jgi:hypothetical protein
MNNGLRIHHLLVVLTVGLIFGAGALAPVAVAQYSEEGVLNAISYKAFPANQPIAVRPLDNSDDNLEIQAEFERILRANGYVVNRDAPLVLSFDTEDRIGAWSDGSRRTVLELEGHGGVIGRDSARARFNIFDSQRGGIVNERPGNTNIVTPSRYRLNVSVDETSSGERLWRGWATADLQQNSGAALTKAMVPVLVKNLGATVKSEPFDLF